ncbi:c-type cytochrome [Alkalilimnicola sp. S0819]|uniref:c-type cytochrome n=1 Tax=Alkalilimnicola sp. S0819 TaxID=2613922 RepID=UPI001261EEDD|nr:c-type cytochrome [Alkalilimnicola sp. S0819]KAB7623965.1 c-type cytochrome [Alkalilimnicola sp. S0819]MPQ16566.1 c-type cytochrome [Alkalilimnicola sp. S0819]
MDQTPARLRAPSPRIARGACIGPVLAALALTGCKGTQSALQPAGPQAEAAASLWWLMLWGAVAVLGLVMLLALLAARLPRHERPAPRLLLIVGGGVALPIVSLSALQIYGHSLGAPSVEARAAGLQIRVSAQSFWWRFSYPQHGGLHSAGVLHLPVGETVDLTLASGDVIHSFWVPRLAGKRDLIPGRATHIQLRADQAGVFRGQCAEFCGAEHARMSFVVVAQPRTEFDAWLQAQARPAAEPTTALARRGRRAFEQAGCGACHRIRGTGAWGSAGPDLTHVASRWRLRRAHTPEAAGGLGAAEGMADWIRRAHQAPDWLAEETVAPASGQRLRAIASYLQGLE